MQTMNSIVVTAALNEESFKALAYFVQEIYECEQ